MITLDLSGVCQWKKCRKRAKPGGWFCADHANLLTPGRAFEPDRLKWAKDLSFAVGTGIASSAIYDLLKLVAEHGHLITLSPTSQSQVKQLLDKDFPSDPGAAIQHYVTLSQDPVFCRTIDGLLGPGGPDLV